jgi:zinc protease
MIDRLKPPAFTPPAPFVLPHAKKHVLRGGVPVHYLDLGKQPLLKIDFIFPFGKSTEPNKGINYLTAKMLTEGTQILYGTSNFRNPRLLWRLYGDQPGK